MSRWVSFGPASIDRAQIWLGRVQLSDVLNQGRLPDFVIVGAMRAGTTSLYRYLGEHPEVFVAPKELCYFTEHFEKGIGWYREQFVRAHDVAVAGEATADYLARRSAMERLAATLPEAKLIVSLRHPVDRTYSHYGLLAARGREERSFSRAIDDELSRIASDGDDARNVLYLSHSLYDKHLTRAFRLFPRDHVLVSILERMADDPQQAFASICGFLGVNPRFVPENLGAKINPYVTFRSLRLRRIALSMPSSLGRGIARLNTRQSDRQPELGPDTLEKLQEFFAPRIERVERLIGEKIKEWR